MSSSGTGIIVDLSPLNGQEIHGVKYSWGSSTNDHCCPSDVEAFGKCEPISCPLMGKMKLPVNPFFAKVNDGECLCVAPNKC